MSIGYEPVPGFVAHNGGPDRSRPGDWIVWHFTHIDNLPSVVASGRLLPDSAGAQQPETAADAVRKWTKRKGRIFSDDRIGVALDRILHTV